MGRGKARKVKREFSHLCRHHKKGNRPHIFGDGTKTRDYIYVDDVRLRAHAGLDQRKQYDLEASAPAIETSDEEIFDEIERNMKSGIKTRL